MLFKFLEDIKIILMGSNARSFEKKAKFVSRVIFAKYHPKKEIKVIGEERTFSSLSLFPLTFVNLP